MWKLLFDTGYIFSCLIPCTKWREHFRVHTMFDYKNKLRALYTQYPELKNNRIKLGKGGGSLAFIINKKTVYKVRKYDANVIHERIAKEKRITDALRPFCEVQIPQIEIVHIGQYVFYKQVFIPGKLLVNVSSSKIKKYQDKISKQLAKFIYNKSLCFPQELHDLSGDKKDGYSWLHSDMCSNILINPKTMIITGIIDWEWATYAPTKHEFDGLVRVRKKMQKIGLDKTTSRWYNKIVPKNNNCL